MKRNLFLASAALLAGLFISASVMTTSADAQMKNMQHDERVKLMKMIGGGMKAAKQATTPAAMAEAGKKINAASKKLADAALWPAGSHDGTRAKAEIWQNMADFKAKLKETEDASANLIKVSMGGNLGAAKKAFGGVAKTCGGCHKVYRGPKI